MKHDWVGRSIELTPQVRNFVNGTWQSEGGGGVVEKYGPRDGRLLYGFGSGNALDADLAVQSARRAFNDGRWSNASPLYRKESLQRLASLIEKHSEEFALLESLDVGKPISEALNFDVPAAAAYIRSSAEGADKVFGKVYAVDQSSLTYQLRRPVGVVAGVIGWNFPLYLTAMKVGPVLATGNSLVLKPSELTSLSASRVAELAMEAGIPAGVFNVIHGDAGVGAALAHHHDVDLLTFTGSSRTGKKLLVAAGESNMKRLILECGGKAPNIVFDDCPDLECVAEAIIARAFWNQGEVCSASSRLLIEESIKDKLMQFLVAKAATLSPGDPLNAQTTFGALVSRSHQRKVLDYIDGARAGGARLLHQSVYSPPFDEGFYVPPTIFDQVSSDQKIAQEEIFGPVLSVIAFRNEAEAIKIANSTIYGLTAILWTKDLARAHRVAHGIDAGMTVINATAKPVGGPGVGIISVGGHKESGIGAEGGLEGLEQYMNQTTVQYFI